MSAIETARAMIAQLTRGPWQEVHVRTSEVELFLARSDGGSNPMRARPVAAGAGLAEPGEAAAVATIVRAPHVATFVSAPAVGSRIVAGEAVCRLDLLGEAIDVPADVDGILAAVDASTGDLVEYGMPLVRVRAG